MGAAAARRRQDLAGGRGPSGGQVRRGLELADRRGRSDAACRQRVSRLRTPQLEGVVAAGGGIAWNCPRDDRDDTRMALGVRTVVPTLLATACSTSGRLDELTGRVDRIETRLDAVDERLRDVEGALGKVDQRLRIIERNVVGRGEAAGRHRVARPRALQLEGDVAGG